VSLRFFSDHCVPTELSDTLRHRGHQVTLLREALPIHSPDPAVIAKAQELGAVLLSLNGDFADIVRYPPGRYLGIVSIQLHNHPEIIPQLLECLLSFLDAHPQQEFFHGKLFVVELHRIRIRR
jgi:predicted nuclease of predicted toxin-antitoxin system